MTKLAKVTLTFSEGQKVLELDPDGVTIFVGPNGSGKSLALREIERQISDGQEPQTKLVTSVDFDWPTEEEVIEFLEESIDFANRKLANNLAVPRLVPGKEGNFSTNLDLAILRNVLKAKSNKRYVAHTPSILFVNAQNKQTIKKMIEPLRRFGIPAAAIPDIDVIKDGGQEWSDWLSSIMYPSVLHPGMATTRSHLQKLFESSGRDMKRGGIGLLDPAQQSAFEVFAGGLAEYGMFVVPFGELESWLPELAVSRTKAKFALEAIVALGEDPASTGYAKPSDNDVWAFMRKIIEWVRNPARKGTG